MNQQNQTEHKFIYLDNSATTPCYPEVVDAMLPYFTYSYGNPSSLYPLGREAHNAVEYAREIIASSINADPDEIYFTSGATESNNLIFIINSEKKCLTTAIEHPSVYNQPDTEYISVNDDGFVDMNNLENLFASDYVGDFFSCMLANNEIGSIQDIGRIGDLCSTYQVRLHVDATQGFCTIPIDVKDMNICYLSASAHKIHGPKGIGFMYINKDMPKPQIIFGGGQERGYRSGTENVPGIVGFGKAVEISLKNRESDIEKLKKLRQYTHYQIMNNITDVQLNGTSDFDKRLPNNLNYRFKDIYADELVEMLAEKGIYCSAGSACHSGNSEPSHVLRAIGLSDDEARSSVRFSLGADLDKEDIDRAVKAIIDCVKVLRIY